MRERIISADGHIDLPCLPVDLFTAYAPARLRERVPHVVERDGERVWVTEDGTYMGHVGGVGPNGSPISKHTSPRIERMAAKGLYEDQARGVMRTTIPELRAKDMEGDGVVGEVIYGILLVASSLKDPEAAALVVRAYNDFLAEFCKKLPGRFAGIGVLAGGPDEAAAEAAVDEDTCAEVFRSQTVEVEVFQEETVDRGVFGDLGAGRAQLASAAVEDLDLLSGLEGGEGQLDPGQADLGLGRVEAAADGLDANACPSRDAKLTSVVVVSTSQGGQNAAVVLKQLSNGA